MAINPSRRPFIGAAPLAIGASKFLPSLPAWADDMLTAAVGGVLPVFWILIGSGVFLTAWSLNLHGHLYRAYRGAGKLLLHPGVDFDIDQERSQVSLQPNLRVALCLTVKNRRKSTVTLGDWSVAARSKRGATDDFHFLFLPDGSTDFVEKVAPLDSGSKASGFAIFECSDRLDITSLRLTFRVGLRGFGRYTCRFAPELWYEMLGGNARIRFRGDR